jgi:hypothetical protein
MKKLLSLGIVSLLVMAAMTLSSSQDRAGPDRGRNDAIRDQFVGAWRLASLEQEGADGKIRKSDSAGLLVFTRDGHMSVQVMDRNPQPQTPAGPEQYSQGGYEASFGTYEINDAQTLLITSRAHWCGRLSAKTCRARSRSRANS